MTMFNRLLATLVLAGFTSAVVLTLLSSRLANAEQLNAAETEAVLLEGSWKLTDTGAVYNYWSWSSNGTLCVKANDPQAENCDDTGSWTRDGTRSATSSNGGAKLMTSTRAASVSRRLNLARTKSSMRPV